MDEIRGMMESLLAKSGSPGLPNQDRYAELSEAKQANPEPYFMMIKEMFVETNACTDTINGYLKDGPWHILAICPQPGQRRPDYILGKL